MDGIVLGLIGILFGHQLWINYKLGKVEQAIKDLNPAYNVSKVKHE